jgi:hypothetical protein
MLMAAGPKLPCNLENVVRGGGAGSFAVRPLSSVAAGLLSNWASDPVANCNKSSTLPSLMLIRPQSCNGEYLYLYIIMLMLLLQLQIYYARQEYHTHLQKKQTDTL